MDESQGRPVLYQDEEYLVVLAEDNWAQPYHWSGESWVSLEAEEADHWLQLFYRLMEEAGVKSFLAGREVPPAASYPPSPGEEE